MEEFIRIGVDLGKRYFQIHAPCGEEGQAVTRKLPRARFLALFAGAAPCLIGMEACGSAHYWARQLRAMGHDVRPIPPLYVKPYVKRGKNDAVDAAAVCEAVSRPAMRFVPVERAGNQAALMLHKTRELPIKQQTMCLNALRGHLSEFGLVAAKGIGHVGGLLEMAASDASLPAAAHAAVQVFAAQLQAIAASLDALEKEIASPAQSEAGKLLAGVPGAGKMITSAIAAGVPDPRAFKSARDFAAWLGLTPRQDSTGGKVKLGAIAKPGNRDLRKLLTLGSTALLRVATKRKGALRDWLVALLAKKPVRLVAVALANKRARILWAMTMTGEAFRMDMFEPFKQSAIQA